jgi:hypothetical protein
MSCKFGSVTPKFAITSGAGVSVEMEIDEKMNYTVLWINKSM